MAGIIVGVDAGTTVIKSVAFSLDGEELHRTSRDNAVEHPETGYDEQPMDRTWQKTAETIRGVVDALDGDDDVLGVGVTAQGDGAWFVDDSGEPIRPAILWSDGRAGDVVTRWDEDGTLQRIYDVCGSGLFPGASLTILRWVRDHEPATYDSIGTVFFCKDWLKYKLTGVLASDPSDMSVPYLDIRTGEYAGEVLELVGMEELADRLPPMADGTEVVGGVREEAAEETGLPAGTPVVSGIFDVPASAVGSGARSAGDGSSVVGTTSLNQTLLDEPEFGSAPVGLSFALGVEDLWSTSMAAMTGTPNLDWAIAELAEGSDFDSVEAAVKDVPIGAGGVLYHPFLSSAGERAPFSDPKARAQFFGLTQDHTRAHVLRAVYEGVALSMRDCYEHLPYDTDEIFLSGGGANSELWCRMFADCLDASVLVPEGSEFGAKGVALLAGIGVGVYDDLESAVGATSSVARSYEPRPSNVRQYRRWYAVYRDAYEHTADVWEDRARALEDLEKMRATPGGDVGGRSHGP